MKKIIFTICLMLLIGMEGCAQVILYHPDKTLEQSRQDSLDCEFHDPYVIWLPFKAPGAPPYYLSCMERKGYTALTNEEWKQLNTKTKIQQAIPYSEYYISGK